MQSNWAVDYYIVNCFNWNSTFIYREASHAFQKRNVSVRWFNYWSEQLATLQFRLLKCKLLRDKRSCCYFSMSANSDGKVEKSANDRLKFNRTNIIPASSSNDSTAIEEIAKLTPSPKYKSIDKSNEEVIFGLFLLSKGEGLGILFAQFYWYLYSLVDIKRTTDIMHLITFLATLQKRQSVRFFLFLLV